MKTISTIGAVICVSLLMIQSGNGQTNNAVIPILRPDRSAASISIYTSQINDLIVKPEGLNILSLDALMAIESHLCAAYLKDSPKVDNWNDLRITETKLIGYIYISLNSRLDPSIDMQRTVQMSYLPFDATPIPEADKKDPAKEKAYNDWVLKQTRLDDLQVGQLIVQRDIKTYIREENIYLRRLFPDPDSKSLEIETLKQTGLDSNAINLLIGK